MLYIVLYILWNNIAKPQYSVTFFEKISIFSRFPLDETRRIRYNNSEEEFFNFSLFTKKTFARNADRCKRLSLFLETPSKTFGSGHKRKEGSKDEILYIIIFLKKNCLKLLQKQSYFLIFRAIYAIL